MKQTAEQSPFFWLDKAAVQVSHWKGLRTDYETPEMIRQLQHAVSALYIYAATVIHEDGLKVNLSFSPDRARNSMDCEIRFRK